MRYQPRGDGRAQDALRDVEGRRALVAGPGEGQGASAGKLAAVLVSPAGRPGRQESTPTRSQVLPQYSPVPTVVVRDYEKRKKRNQMRVGFAS